MRHFDFQLFHQNKFEKESAASGKLYWKSLQCHLYYLNEPQSCTSTWKAFVGGEKVANRMKILDRSRRKTGILNSNWFCVFSYIFFCSTMNAFLVFYSFWNLYLSLWMLSPNFQCECLLFVQQTINKSVRARCENKETTVTKKHNFTLFFNMHRPNKSSKKAATFMFKSTLPSGHIELSRTAHYPFACSCANVYSYIFIVLSEIQVVFFSFLSFPFLFAFHLSQVLLFYSPSHWKMCTNVLSKWQTRQQEKNHEKK